jgi:hypothetical protein
MSIQYQLKIANREGKSLKRVNSQRRLSLLHLTSTGAQFEQKSNYMLFIGKRSQESPDNLPSSKGKRPSVVPWISSRNEITIEIPVEKKVLTS